MIKKVTYGIHQDVIFAEFGNGTISFTGARVIDEEIPSQLVFRNQEQPKEIGSTTNEDMGKSTNDLERPELVFHFKNPQSITALVTSLLELQQQMFNEQPTPIIT